MRRLALMMLLATPAMAEDAPVLDASAAAAPGAVALYLQARELAALGQARKDPLLVLTAARLLHGLRLTDTPRQTDPAQDPRPVTAPDAAALLALARQLDAGENYADLTDMLAREVSPAPLALRATASTLAPGASEVWTLPFFGGAQAELAILGDGTTNLDLLVTAAGETQICQDSGSADRAYCGFVLKENGDVTITVSNVGTAPGSYILLTE